MVNNEIMRVPTFMESNHNVVYEKYLKDTAFNLSVFEKDGGIFEGFKIDSGVVTQNDMVVFNFQMEDYYLISNLGKEFQFPTPIHMNDLINDCSRVGVTLYWTNEIFNVLSPIVCLVQENIGKYFDSLLNSIEKGHELNM